MSYGLKSVKAGQKVQIRVTAFLTSSLFHEAKKRKKALTGVVEKMDDPYDTVIKDIRLGGKLITSGWGVKDNQQYVELKNLKLLKRKKG